MAEFIPNDFTPVGSQARKGNAPQVFAYTTVDLESEARADGYFNKMRGVLQTNDWIYAVFDTAGSNHFGVFIVGQDGIGLGADSAAVNTGGTGYVVGDRLTVAYVGGKVLRTTILQVGAISGSAITALIVIDPGSILSFSSPLTDLALVSVNGNGSGSGATVDIVLTSDLDVVLNGQHLSTDT